MIEFGRAEARRLLGVAAVVALVVTAGCAGLGADGENGAPDGPDSDDRTNETEPDEGSDRDPEENSDAGPDDDADGPGTSLGEFGDLAPAETDRPAESLLADSADALAAADSYRLEQRVVNVREQNNQNRTIRLNQTTRVDRTARRITAQGTTTTPSQSVTVTRYLLNGSLYESSEQIARQFGSQWVQTNVSARFDRLFRQFDSAAQIEPLFENATATVEGQTRIDGQRVYAITATVNETALVESREGVVGAERFQLNVWLSAERSVPVRVAEDSTLRLSTAVGEITQRTDSVIDYSFEDVEISLPPAAEGAPSTRELTER